MIYYESILARRDDSVPKVQKEVTIMNSYETLYIIKPTVEDEAREALIAKFAAIITENGGEVENIDISVHPGGDASLALQAQSLRRKGYGEGYYVLVNFKAPAELPLELERNFKINENIMRYMTIKRDLKKEAKAAEIAAANAAAAEQAK